ncbi:GntP family permease [Glutamicibacter sp. AOP5-A2-18]|uniref:GntP family permease n=1 Tax=Glutamicibacter sp. AOP5-A2-18 TaxID=3457656 RepID=UPI004033297F
MSDTAILINTAVAVLATVLLIVKFKVNPVIGLVLGSLYLGLSTGLGITKTVETITQGFGDIMVEVGLLIAFGVLMGAILNEVGAIRRLVERLLSVFGPKFLPYSMAVAMSTVLQSIFVDVLLVISAPLARRMAPKIGPLGTARLATAMAISLECGIIFMVPGVGALALAGVLEVPLGTMLICGLIVVVPTVLLAIMIMSFLFRRGFWKPERDEQNIFDEEDYPQASLRNTAGTKTQNDADEAQSEPGAVKLAVDPQAKREAPLWVLFAPLLLSLILIAVGAVTEIAKIHNGVLELLGNPVVALLIGLIGTTIVGRRTLGQKGLDEAITTGFKDSGQILLLTGAGGSLAATVAAAGLGDILGGFFSASAVAPLVVVWVIAAVLHIAVGSVTLSAITAAGMLAPIAPALGLDPVLIALAAGAGSLFMIHVTSNTFWLLQSLLGQTMRGALKSVSVGVSVASVIALGMVLTLSIFI